MEIHAYSIHSSVHSGVLKKISAGFSRILEVTLDNKKDSGTIGCDSHMLLMWSKFFS
jgi:hypothetical protein